MGLILGTAGGRRAVSWRPVPQWLRRGERADAELDAELRDHVERQVADHVRAGVPAAEGPAGAHVSSSAASTM